MLKGFAPATSRDGERDREDSGKSRSVESSLGLGEGGEGGKLLCAGVWKGKSVGDIYRPEEDGPAAESSGSSSMGVIGGGGVRGGGGEDRGLALSGDDSGGEKVVRFGRRDRCERLEGL